MKGGIRSLCRLIIFLLFVSIVIIGGSNLAKAETSVRQACYSLTLTIDGGIGSLPTASSPNCPGGLYAEGTVVTLVAQPGPGFSVYRWRGTDNDTSADPSNTVTMTANKEVGIHYIESGDPARSVSWGTPGGVATVPRLRLPVSIVGPDDRVRITNTTDSPWRGNAYLELYDDDGDSTMDALCTGWFVGPHTLITAGHCVYDSSLPGSHWEYAVRVVPGKNGSAEPNGYAWATQIRSVSGWVNSGLSNYDIGAVILGSDTLGNQVGWYHYGYYSDTFLLGIAVAHIAGYPGDKPLGTQWHDTDPVAAVSSGEVSYAIDTYAGESGAAVWYTGSTADYVIAVHTNGVGSPSCASGNNCGTRITHDLAQTIQSWGAATPPDTDIVPVPNDDFGTPIIIASMPYSNVQDTGGATTMSDDPLLGCVSGKGSHTVWYRFTPANNAVLGVDTLGSNYDTVLAIWTGARGALTSRGCNDDSSGTFQSSLQIGVTGGTTYYIEIAGFADTSSGSLHLNASIAPPAPGLISPLNGSTTSDSTPTFTWNSSSGANNYQLQVDDNSNFGSPVVDTTTGYTNYTPTTPLADGMYYWRVRARDAAGNWSAWSSSWSLTIRITPTLSGYVRTSGGSGIAGVVMNGLPGTPSTAADGSYSVVVNYGWSGTVTPQKACLGFSPPSRTYTNVTADQANQNYTGVEATYTISGYVQIGSGMGVSGVAMNGLPGTPSTNSSGYYTGNVSCGWSGTVTPQKTGYTFTPPTRAYANTVVNQTDQNYLGTQDTTVPAAPILSAPGDQVNTIDTTPQFTWRAVTGATQYRLQVDDNPGFGSPATIGADLVSRTTYTVPNLYALPYGVYHWRVQAGRASGLWGDWSSVRRFTVTILASPTNAQHLTDTTPTFTWRAVPGALQYEFQLDDSANLSSPLIGPTSTGTVRRFTPLTPLASDEYFWSVRVQTVSGWSAWMPAWSLTVTAPPPLRPVLVSPAAGARLDTPTPTFSWGAVPDGYVYQIQIDNVSTFSSPEQDVTLSPGVLTYTASALPDGGRYYWRVRAINATGVAGSWSGVWSFTLAPLAAPAPVSPPNGTTSADTTPDLAWSAVAGGVSYEVQIGTTATFGTLVQRATTSALLYTASALPDGKYYWRVRAVAASGVSGRWSGVRNFTIDTTGPAAPVPRSPANQAGTSDTTPTFTWTAPSGARGYQFQLSTDLVFTGDPVIAVTGTSYTQPTALPYGVYYWRVQARDALSNWGDWSPATSFAVTALKAPKDGSSTTDTTPTFTWAAVSGATGYVLQVDTTPGFSSAPLPFTYTGPNRSATPPSAAPLTAGRYYWRVQVLPAGTWTPTWTFTVTPPLPGRPVLLAPVNAALTNDSTPLFTWKAAPEAQTYQIQIDNTSSFSSPEQDVTVGVGLLSYLASPLPDGTYSWRVRALNSVGAAGAWSARWTLTVDTLAPDIPAPIAPLDGASVTNARLRLSWGKVTDAARYELQLDPYPAFPLPPIDVRASISYKPPTPLSRAVYHWRVRAIDRAGNASGWSTPRRFDLVAGVTAPLPPAEGVQGTPPAVPVEATPTVTVEVLPTETPVPLTLTPLPPTPGEDTLQTLESDDPAVQQTGVWTAHDTPYASGGRYLFSSGSRDDALTLSFTGSQVDIVYVRHPALGVFVVEVDGSPLQLVDSVAPDSEFGARVTVSVSPGPHTLRVYPMTGTIAIDAFAVEPQVVLATETPAPTGEPTEPAPITATPLPTTEPTGAVPPPTDEGLPTPTALPLPVTLPLVETFDSGQGWLASGAWRFDPQTAYRGAGWVADGTSRDQTSTLTAQAQIDLRAAFNPELSFWQRASLASADVMAVDLSLDGGLTWFPVDQQAGASFDWTPRTVSLGRYRGAVVALRFRLETPGALPEGVPSAGWWIDELVVQDAPVVPPTVVPTEPPAVTPLPTEAPTELPTAIPTELPSATPLPTEAPTELPAVTPLPTEIPAPTEESADRSVEEPPPDTAAAS